MRRRRPGRSTSRTISAAVAVVIAAALVIATVIASPARAATAQRLRVTILADSDDARIPAIGEAIAHWNTELARLGIETRLDYAGVVRAPVPEAELRAASSARGKPWSFFTDRRLRGALSRVPGDITIALSRTEVISFGVTMSDGAKGVVGIRRADVPPLSLPNTLRNVAAHEIGHVLGLAHNEDSATLMCGRPAPCRPAVFASGSSHFFPLTARDEQRLRARWR